MKVSIILTTVLSMFVQRNPCDGAASVLFVSVTTTIEAVSTVSASWRIMTKRGRNINRLQLIDPWCGMVQREIYLRGSFVSFREMITSQLQGKLWLDDEVRGNRSRVDRLELGLDGNVW
ncbi:hypothetical protein Tco_0206038 [Tanacetum coccineum]